VINIIWLKRSSLFDGAAQMRPQIGPLTKILLSLNAAVSAVTLWPAAFNILVLAGGLFPARFVDGDAQFSGATYLLPVWLTPISSAFLHGGLMHLGFNMMLLLLVGGAVEQILGWKGLLALYVVGIFASAAAEVLVAPHSLAPVIGASGAVSSVLAAYLLLFPNAPPKDWGKMPAKYARPLQLLLMWVLINLAMGFAGPAMGMSIAIYAHIGGFLAGLLLTRPLLLWKYRGA
jgi:membrane associated rhomboid family serine protease